METLAEHHVTNPALAKIDGKIAVYEILVKRAETRNSRALEVLSAKLNALRQQRDELIKNTSASANAPVVATAPVRAEVSVTASPSASIEELRRELQSLESCTLSLWQHLNHMATNQYYYSQTLKDEVSQLNLPIPAMTGVTESVVLTQQINIIKARIGRIHQWAQLLQKQNPLNRFCNEREYIQLKHKFKLENDRDDLQNILQQHKQDRFVPTKEDLLMLEDAWIYLYESLSQAVFQRLEIINYLRSCAYGKYAASFSTNGEVKKIDEDEIKINRKTVMLEHVIGMKEWQIKILQQELTQKTPAAPAVSQSSVFRTAGMRPAPAGPAGEPPAKKPK